MCRCTPGLKSPFCGVGDCQWPTPAIPMPAGAAVPKPSVEDRLAALERAAVAARPHGCICPPGAEAGCRGFACPRRPTALT